MHHMDVEFNEYSCLRSSQDFSNRNNLNISYENKRNRQHRTSTQSFYLYLPFQWPSSALIASYIDFRGCQFVKERINLIGTNRHSMKPSWLKATQTWIWCNTEWNGSFAGQIIFEVDFILKSSQMAETKIIVFLKLCQSRLPLTFVPMALLNWVLDETVSLKGNVSAQNSIRYLYFHSFLFCSRKRL